MLYWIIQFYKFSFLASAARMLILCHSESLWGLNDSFGWKWDILAGSFAFKESQPLRMSLSQPIRSLLGSMLSFTEDLRKCHTWLYDALRLVLMELLNCWQSSTPFWCEDSLRELNIGNWNKCRRCSLSPFRRLTGNDVSGPLFSLIFSHFLFLFLCCLLFS